MENYDCEECKKKRDHRKLQQIRNCGYIDIFYWKFPSGYNIANQKFTECPGSILTKNVQTIGYIQSLARKGNSTLSLTDIENKAILDYENARDNALEIKKKRDEKKNK